MKPEYEVGFKLPYLMYGIATITEVFSNERKDRFCYQVMNDDADVFYVSEEEINQFVL